MRCFAMFVLVIIGTIPKPAMAHEIPLNTLRGLIQNCTLQDDDQGEVEHHTGLCLGFIKGVTNALAVHNQLKVCAPSALENGDLIEAVMSRARKAPKELLDESSAMFVEIVLQNAFPCR